MLWVLVHALLRDLPLNSDISIFTGDRWVTDEAIYKHVEQKFSISIDPDQRNKIHFIRISSRFLLEAKWYPVFTMLFQSLASMVIGLECLVYFQPHLLVDTIGCPFIYPIFKVFGACAEIIAYIHYPIISSDMLEEVANPRPNHSNAYKPPSFWFLFKSRFKILYYRGFALLYGLIGYFADVAVVNSSWTEGHIRHLWWMNKQIVKVFPPCNTNSLVQMDISRERSRTILSVGQFRPEKDHFLQISSFRMFQLKYPQYSDVELVIIGGTRNAQDLEFVKELFNFSRKYCHGDTCQLFRETSDEGGGLNREIGKIRFIVDAEFSTLMHFLSVASIGLHTMWNEHFGISLVEMMAAGLIVVAHDSGGPKIDIVGDIFNEGAAYLASSAEEYAESFHKILSTTTDKIPKLRLAARTSAKRFSDSHFSTAMVEIVVNSFTRIKKYR